MPTFAFTPISSFVRETLDRQSGGHVTGDDLQQVLTIWRTLLKDPLGVHCRPVRMAADRLVVHADSPVWASQLRHRSATIMHELRAAGHPGLAGLRIRVVAASPITRRPVSPPRRPGPGMVELVRSTAAGITDLKLRTSLLSLAAALEGAVDCEAPPAGPLQDTRGGPADASGEM